MSQSRFICQVVCTGMQGTSAFVPGVPSAKVCSSVSFVYWYSRHLCSSMGGPLAEEGSSAKFDN